MNDEMFVWHDENDYLEHHGILGQKWGVRRYQNDDGTLTPEGRVHYKKQSSYAKATLKTATKLVTKPTAGAIGGAVSAISATGEAGAMWLSSAIEGAKMASFTMKYASASTAIKTGMATAKTAMFFTGASSLTPIIVGAAATGAAVGTIGAVRKGVNYYTKASQAKTALKNDLELNKIKASK